MAVRDPLILAAALRAVVLKAIYPALILPDSVRELQYAQNFTVGQWSADALIQSGFRPIIGPRAALLVDHLAAQHLGGAGHGLLAMYAGRHRF